MLFCQVDTLNAGSLFDPLRASWSDQRRQQSMRATAYPERSLTGWLSQRQSALYVWGSMGGSSKNHRRRHADPLASEWPLS